MMVILLYRVISVIGVSGNNGDNTYLYNYYHYLLCPHLKKGGNIALLLSVGVPTVSVHFLRKVCTK